ncbi:hypothetical protein D3C79_692040 [compost metagenome]
MADHGPTRLERLVQFVGPDRRTDRHRRRVSLQYLARRVGDQHGVQLRVLGLQAACFFLEQRSIGKVAAQALAAVLQAFIDRVQKLIDARGDLEGIGTVGLQCRMHQRIALHTVGRDQAVAEGTQHGEQDKAKNQATQADTR